MAALRGGGPLTDDSSLAGHSGALGPNRRDGTEECAASGRRVTRGQHTYRVLRAPFVAAEHVDASFERAMRARAHVTPRQPQQSAQGTQCHETGTRTLALLTRSAWRRWSLPHLSAAGALSCRTASCVAVAPGATTRPQIRAPRPLRRSVLSMWSSLHSPGQWRDSCAPSATSCHGSDWKLSYFGCKPRVPFIAAQTLHEERPTV